MYHPVTLCPEEESSGGWLPGGGTFSRPESVETTPFWQFSDRVFDMTSSTRPEWCLSEWTFCTTQSVRSEGTSSAPEPWWLEVSLTAVFFKTFLAWRWLSSWFLGILEEKDLLRMAEYQISSDQEIQILHLLSMVQLQQDRQEEWLSHLAFLCPQEPRNCGITKKVNWNGLTWIRRSPNIWKIIQIWNKFHTLVANKQQ